MENRRQPSTKGRRLSDVDFNSCPKFLAHDISEEQILSIAKKAVMLAKEEAKLELAEGVIDFGKDLAKKLFIIIGAVAIFVLTWLQSHGEMKL
jgi:hypothetical protein